MNKNDYLCISPCPVSCPHPILSYLQSFPHLHLVSETAMEDRSPMQLPALSRSPPVHILQLSAQLFTRTPSAYPLLAGCPFELPFNLAKYANPSLSHLILSGSSPLSTCNASTGVVLKAPTHNLRALDCILSRRCSTVLAVDSYTKHP